MNRGERDELGLRQEYTICRVEALWRHSPAARAAVRSAVVHAGIEDPGVASASQMYELAVSLFDLDGAYPQAEHEARVMHARLRGTAIARGGGTIRDATKFARDWLPDMSDELLDAWKVEQSRAPLEGAQATKDHR